MLVLLLHNDLIHPYTLYWDRAHLRYQGGQVGAFFADVPEAITAGTKEAEALDRAQDALTVALSGYLDDGRPLPVPSKARRGQSVVVLPPRVAIKLAIHEAMCERRVTQSQ